MQILVIFTDPSKIFDSLCSNSQAEPANQIQAFLFTQTTDRANQRFSIFYPQAQFFLQARFIRSLAPISRRQ